tara:strand:+ start:2248 stop:2418 length:171 start_codon:yes stop_codon:yes gene_type:complete
MRIVIERAGDAIATIKDLKNIDGRGEIAHILTELELIKQELLLVWVNYDDSGDDGR